MSANRTTCAPSPAPRPSRRRSAGSRSSSSCSWQASGRSARSPPSACIPRSRRTCPTRARSRTSRSPRSRSSTTGRARSSSPGSATSRREVVTFDQIPKVLLDATTAVEDKTFWENAGFDPGRDRVRRARARSAATAGALDDHPAARPRAPARPGARQGPAPDGRAQAQGDHPVDPPDQRLPGRGGQADDHHRLPQPELLRQPELRREGGGRFLLRDRPLEDHARPGGDHRRAARSRRRTTTSSATPSRSAR